MYKKFFGLRKNPFGVNPDPRFLYVMPRVKETLACLQYGIKMRKGFIVITGEVGTGKTTLLRAAFTALGPSKIATAFLFNPRLEVLDFFEFVLTDLGIPIQNRTKSSMLAQLNRWLLERHLMGETVALIIDEAQCLSAELLEEVRLLTNLETSTEKLIQVVLCGQPELENKLSDPALRQLRQRVSLWSRTQPLTLEETRGYVEERLRIAGATTRIFSDEALDAIYGHSGGIPRIVNLLCEHALINCFVEQVSVIPASSVEAVGKEFGFHDEDELQSEIFARPARNSMVRVIGEGK
jgi:type II secretory pathway predicted ATPase ExeA